MPKIYFEGFLFGGVNPSEKYARQIGSFPQIGVKIKNIWNHHLVDFFNIESNDHKEYALKTYSPCRRDMEDLRDMMLALRVVTWSGNGFCKSKTGCTSIELSLSTWYLNSMIWPNY